jgi:RNA polymerase primary sigma factor
MVASKTLSPYLEGMLAADLLTAEEEQELFAAMNRAKQIGRRRQAEKIRNQIVAANVRLVVSVAKKFAGLRHPLGELVSEGNMTLIRAVEKFDPDRGFRFSTYATWALRYNFARIVAKKPSEATRFPGGEELLADVPDRRGDPSDDRRLAAGGRALARMLAELDPREHEIMLRRYGLRPGCEEDSLQEIATEMGVCKERVRQLQIRALDKLRAKAAELGLERFEPI